MRPTSTLLRLGLASAAALLIAGCGSRPAATANNSSAENLSADLATPMNDASALESAGNAAIATPPPADSNMTNAADTQPIANPGNVGGDTVQSNVTGM